MRIRTLFALVLAAAVAARAQEALNPPSPFVALPAAPSPGGSMVTLAAAQRAQELGFPSAAAELYTQQLAEPGGDHAAAALGLVTALLDDGRTAEARQALDAQVGLRDSAWHLRAGLVAIQQRQTPAARTEAAAVREADLGAGDRGWWFYLQGLIADADGDGAKAKDYFGQAEAAATSAPARARFLLKREQARLRTGPASEADAERQKKNLEQYQGRKVGYDIARTYAVTLDALGRKNEAVSVLQRQLVGLPPEERAELDEMRLLLGLIAGAETGAGRNALEQLLDHGADRDKQRIALQLLARASARDPQRAGFRKRLDELIAATPVHPILEDLLLFRAQVALQTKTLDGYSQAEDDARALLTKFPGSPLKPHAFGVLTQSAWEQRRYRTAADNAAKARAELAGGPEHAALGVLVAEAWFRARDFRAAADAYSAAVREVPAGVTPGELMFQRVESEIEADSPAGAARVLDELARDPGFDPVNRWQAEWNLARTRQARGQTADAYARVKALLAAERAGGGAAALPVELRARMAWLQARLAWEVGRPEETLAIVDGLAAALAGATPALRSDIASAGELLRAEANFALDREAAALDGLKKLRADFPRTDAGVYSYFVEADHYAKQDKTVEAQQLLTKVADDFPESPYAPFALFQAALQAERRGQDSNFIEANKLIEALVNKYPDSPLVFAARLRQGDLLRKLNQYPQAQRAYEDLVNKYPQREDVALAQLALAECHNAQSTSEPSHAESALVLFEHVRDRIDAPLDARVEAGYNLGRLQARLGRPAKAEAVWWRDVVTAFLLDEAAAPQLGQKGRYWMTRTLLELGALYEQQEKLEQAKEAWLLILKTKLPGEALARARLARFGLPEAKP
jgi:cellulose synthase operon protein C